MFDGLAIWVTGLLFTAIMTWFSASVFTGTDMARQCDMVGGFYVRDVVYDCKRRGEE